MIGTDCQMTIVPILLLIFEIIHVKEHLQVVINVRKYYDDNLQKKRWYFFLDFLTALMSYIWIGMPMELFPISLFHSIGHLYYFFTWNYGFYAIRIRQWTSLDKNYARHFTSDLFLTLTDITTHCLMCYYLVSMLLSCD
jgi:hypothetical protein